MVTKRRIDKPSTACRTYGFGCRNEGDKRPAGGLERQHQGEGEWNAPGARFGPSSQACRSRGQDQRREPAPTPRHGDTRPTQEGEVEGQGRDCRALAPAHRVSTRDSPRAAKGSLPETKFESRPGKRGGFLVFSLSRRGKCARCARGAPALQPSSSRSAAPRVAPARSARRSLRRSHIRRFRFAASRHRSWR